MILKDINGKSVNADTFEIKMFRGSAPGEKNKPMMTLEGINTYTAKRMVVGEEKTLLSRRFSIIERCQVTIENCNRLLNRQEELEKECKKIEEEMKAALTLDEINIKGDQWLVDKGYKFYEEDERTYEDICKLFGYEPEEEGPEL